MSQKASNPLSLDFQESVLCAFDADIGVPTYPASSFNSHIADSIPDSP